MRVFYARTQILRNLNQHTLSIVFLLHLIRFRHVIRQLVRVMFVERLDNFHRALAQRLPDGIKKTQNQVHVVRHPRDHLTDVKRIAHITID